MMGHVMEVEQSIDSGKNLIIVSLKGSLHAHDLCNTAMMMIRSLEFTPGMNSLWDLSGARFVNPGREFISILLKFAGSIQSDRGTGYKTAVVARDDITYGYARMLSELGHEIPCTIEVFRDTQEAMTWLSETLLPH